MTSRSRAVSPCSGVPLLSSAEPGTRRCWRHGREGGETEGRGGKGAEEERRKEGGEEERKKRERRGEEEEQEKEDEEGEEAMERRGEKLQGWKRKSRLGLPTEPAVHTVASVRMQLSCGCIFVSESKIGPSCGMRLWAAGQWSVQDFGAAHPISRPNST